VLGRELFQGDLVAADDHDLDLLARAVARHDAALVADREQRTHEVLAVAHAAGGSVDDDANCRL
jgi:hypothetical protein